MTHNAPSPLTIIGSIVSVQGTAIHAKIPRASVGDLCWVTTRSGRSIAGQVIAFHESLFSLALFEDPEGVFPGAGVSTASTQMRVPVGTNLLGRVINPLGVPIDLLNRPLHCRERAPIMNRPPQATSRPVISAPLMTGIRAIDAFCTLGQGQRIGVFASAGVGKSTLLAMMARQASADVIVVALVGERGREVREFIEDTLGHEGLKRSVVVVATSDDSSLMRQTAPYTATAIAEHFRDQGKNVLLIIDSLTRMARAVRETTLAAGELPVRQGYTSSVYTHLPKLLERAGTSPHGSITAIYTVLTNQEDDIDPLADEIKSLLDGHIVLKKELASMGILPAIDISQSISRIFDRLHPHEYIDSARGIVRAFTRYLKERELALLGGTPDDELQRILTHQKELLDLLRQRLGDSFTPESTKEAVVRMAGVLRGKRH